MSDYEPTVRWGFGVDFEGGYDIVPDQWRWEVYLDDPSMLVVLEGVAVEDPSPLLHFIVQGHNAVIDANERL